MGILIFEAFVALVKLFLREMVDLQSSPWKLQGKSVHPSTHPDPAKHYRCAHHFLLDRVVRGEVLFAGEDEDGDLHPCRVLQPESICSWLCLGTWRRNMG